MKRKTMKPKTLMSYPERLRAYERDKDELLRKQAACPPRSSRGCSTS